MTNTINTVSNIINEVKALYGSTVNYWGDTHKLNDAPNDNDPIIDTVSILENLEGYEFDIMGAIEEYNDYLTDEGYELYEVDPSDYDEVITFLYNSTLISSDMYEKGDNSYNWDAPVTQHFNYEVYKATDGGIFITFSVHRFGDVRGNYTDTALLYFDSDYEFYEAIVGCTKNLYITVSGRDFVIDVNPLNNGFEVYENGEDYDYMFTVYGYELDEIREEIREKIA